MFKITLKTLKNCLYLLFFTLIYSCTDDATEPTNGVDGANGFNALVEVQNEAAGDNCSSGGVKISVGQDANENGVLDESEIASISFVCNGSDGADGSDGSDGSAGENGLDLVARTSPENPGDNCQNGGTLVEIGSDTNGNNALDDNEVQTSFFVCNGQDGADGSGSGSNGLTSLIRVSSSSSCANGGITIEVGLDDNDNASLDAGEIDASYDICNGADGTNGTDGANGLSTLSNVITEAPGPNCPNGGLKIELGLDTNQNGVLENDEVVSENYVCNGSNGTDGNDGTDGTNGSNGTSSITRVTNEDPGANCTNGGLLIEIGMDDVTPDGVLQNDEVDYTYYVCNGADGSDGSNGTNGNDGLNSLIRTTTEAPGANCANGGIRIDIGIDANNNNVLEAGEFMGAPLYVCDGVDGANGADGSDGADGRNLIVVTDTDVTCPNGGIEFTFGYDDNNDGIIDEVLEVSLICNGSNGADGSDGSDGSNGSDGTDGLNSIVRSTTESPGANCANGGTLIEVGIDDNRNNVLDAPEVDTFFYICNGQDGSDGSNGNNSLITVSSFTGSQGGCTNGGLIIRTGIDDNGNGVLNTGEIDATSYVCNGDDGTDGTDGSSDGVFEFYFQEGFDSYTGVQDASITDKNPTETGESFSVDRGTTDSHGLIMFPELETLRDRIGEDFVVVEAILYLRGVSGRVDGQSQGNWVGVKTLLPDAPLFEENAVTWTRANSADESWVMGGVTSQDMDGNANGYSDMFQLPPTGNFAFDGYIPLQLSITEVSVWTDRDTGKENNKGLVLLMANAGIQYELDIFSSNYAKDTNFRPLLYLKVKTGVKARPETFSSREYKARWKNMTYQEKLKPLLKRINRQ